MDRPDDDIPRLPKGFDSIEDVMAYGARRLRELKELEKLIAEVNVPDLDKTYDWEQWDDRPVICPSCGKNMVSLTGDLEAAIEMEVHCFRCNKRFKLMVEPVGKIHCWAKEIVAGD